MISTLMAVWPPTDGDLTSTREKKQEEEETISFTIHIEYQSWMLTGNSLSCPTKPKSRAHPREFLFWLHFRKNAINSLHTPQFHHTNTTTGENQPVASAGCSPDQPSRGPSPSPSRWSR